VADSCRVRGLDRNAAWNPAAAGARPALCPRGGAGGRRGKAHPDLVFRVLFLNERYPIMGKG